MIRAFGYQAVAQTNIAQPLLATTLAAAVPVIPAGVTNRYKITVGSTATFTAGDYARFDSAASTDRYKILSIDDVTHMTITLPSDGFPRAYAAHAAGALATAVYVTLGIPINSMFVQCKGGNAASLYIAGARGAKTDGTLCVCELVPSGAGTPPSNFSDARTGSWNAGQSTDWWVVGTANDNYLPSFGAV